MALWKKAAAEVQSHSRQSRNLWPHNPFVRFRDYRLPARKALLQLPSTVPSTVPAVAAQSFLYCRRPPRKALLQFPSTVPQASAVAAQSFCMVSRLPPAPRKALLQLPPQCHASLLQRQLGRTVLLYVSETAACPPERLCCSFQRHRPSTVPAVAAQSFCAPRKALNLRCSFLHTAMHRPSTVPAVAAQSFCTFPRLPPAPPKGSAAASSTAPLAFYSASCGRTILLCPPKGSEPPLQLPSHCHAQAFYSASCGRTVLLHVSETAACPPERLCCSFLHSATGLLQCQLWPGSQRGLGQGAAKKIKLPLVSRDGHPLRATHDNSLQRLALPLTNHKKGVGGTRALAHSINKNRILESNQSETTLIPQNQYDILPIKAAKPENPSHLGEKGEAFRQSLLSEWIVC